MVRRVERNSSSLPNQVPYLDKNSHEMVVLAVPLFTGSNKKRQRRQDTRLLEGS